MLLIIKSFCNCLLKTDIISIFNVIKSESTSVNPKSSSKLNYVNVLSNHFTTQNTEYFLDKISKIDTLNYKSYLQCLSDNNIDIIWNKVLPDMKTSPKDSSDLGGPSGRSGASYLAGPSEQKRRKSPSVLLSPSDAKLSKAAKTDKDHIYEFLPFDTKREPVDLNKVIEDINKKI